MHYLPFLIDYEGEAPIQNFFIAEKEKQEDEGSTSTSPSTPATDDTLRASFRGRLLRGKSLPLPPEFKGVVLQEELARGADGEKEWRVCGQFSEWSYWNHDNRPAPWDPPQQWMDWLHLSKQIHAQVTEEEMAAVQETAS